MLCEVFPVVAMIMGTQSWPLSGWSESYLEAIHDGLIDQLIGDASRRLTEPPTVSQWLRSVVPEKQVQDDTRLVWIHPLKVQQKNVSIQHAINFVFFVDGDRPISQRQRSLIGETFCDEPTTPIATSTTLTGNTRVLRPRKSQISAPPAAVSTFFGPLAVDDSEEEAEDTASVTNALFRGSNAQLPRAPHAAARYQPTSAGEHEAQGRLASSLSPGSASIDLEIIEQFNVFETTWIASDSDTTDFNINVRELFNVALAAVLFGPSWTNPKKGSITLIRAWIDNTTAISWFNRLSSTNPMAQELNRAIGLAEAIHGFRISSDHIPGNLNAMADAGSRAWDSPHTELWTNYSVGWRQITVPKTIRKIYTQFSTTFRPDHWPTALSELIEPHGSSGATGADRLTSPSGYHPIPQSNQHDLSCLESPAGAEEIAFVPFCPRLVTSPGSMSAILVTESAYMPDTSLLCAGCRGCQHLLHENSQSPSKFYKKCDADATSAPPTIVSCGGLRSWVTTFYSVARSIWPKENIKQRSTSLEPKTFDLKIDLDTKFTA